MMYSPLTCGLLHSVIRGPIGLCSRFRSVLWSGSNGLELALVSAGAAGFLGSVVSARVLGPIGRGSLAVLVVWSQCTGWLLGASLDKVLAVEAQAQLKAGLSYPTNLEARLRRINHGLAAIAATLGTAMGLILFEDPLIAFGLGLASAATVVLELSVGIAVARGEWRAFKFGRLVQPISYSLFLLPLLLVSLEGDQKLRLAAGALICSLWIGCITVIRTLRFGTAPGIMFLETAAGKAHLLRSAVVVHSSTILQFLNGRLDLLIAPWLLSASNVGIYAVASSFPKALGFLGTASAARGLSGVRESGRRRWIPVMAVSGLAVVGSALIPFVFGEDFRAAVAPAFVLVIATAASQVLQGSFGRLLALRLAKSALFCPGPRIGCPLGHSSVAWQALTH